MAGSYFAGPTLDDALRTVIEEVIARGRPIKPTKGSAKELSGILLEITDPRARLSRTEMRGRPFSCLGELCWYLAQTNDLAFISYYIPRYRAYADGDIIYGGYGPRLFAWDGLNQIEGVTNLLRRKPDTRQAVIQLFDRHDILEEHNDVPCTCTLQFLLRDNTLDLFTTMRSNDAWLGLTHDVFCFTMIQEIVARDVSAELGTYKHAVGSLHLYDKNASSANKYLSEGWQPTNMSMPPMPVGNPWPAIKVLLDAESAIRRGTDIDYSWLNTIDSYWADLIRLLLVFKYKRGGNAPKVVEISEKMSSEIYRPFISGEVG